MKNQQPAKAVLKTMKILECLSREPSLGVTELTQRLKVDFGREGMHKSTVYRFVSSLKGLGYIRQDPQTERYSLTPKIFEIGTAVLDRQEVWREAAPVIEQLALETRETIHLAALEDDNLVYLGKIESNQTLRVSMQSRVGQGGPTYCTGVGKALLAHLGRERVNAILTREKPVRFTERTTTGRAELARELESIRRRGYAIDNEEHEIGVRCVAAPIYDTTGKVTAAVSISGPSVRLTLRDLPRYGKIVMRAAAEISSRLGYRENASQPHAT